MIVMNFIRKYAPENRLLCGLTIGSYITLIWWKEALTKMQTKVQYKDHSYTHYNNKKGLKDIGKRCLANLSSASPNYCKQLKNIQIKWNWM